LNSKTQKLVVRVLCALLILLLVLGIAVPAFADAPAARVVLGADLTDDQIAQVYANLGIDRGSVGELTLTNTEERRVLQDFVSDEQLGTRSVSCVYFELLPAGSGLSAALSNVSWTSREMILQALSTAGISDARVIVTAPFPVSGTAALAGVYKAYADITGRSLDESATVAGTQELTTTGELSEALGAAETNQIIDEMKNNASELGGLSDEALNQRIREIAARIHVNLSDYQLGMLRDLCRAFAKLNPDNLRKGAQNVRQTIENVRENGEKAVGFFQRLGQTLQKIASFLERLTNIFSGE